MSVFCTACLIFVSSSAIGSIKKKDNHGKIFNKIASLQIPFIENKGQIKNQQVKYYAKLLRGTAFITKDGQVVYSLSKFEEEKGEQLKVQGWIIREVLVGASISQVEGKAQAITKVNFFKGNDPTKWEKNISTYNMVDLGEVYEGIELELKAYGNNVEKLFYVTPKANPASIKVKMDGAKALKVNDVGELEVQTGLGVIKFTKPVAYQEEDGKKKQIDVAYVIKGDEYSFRVGNYDREKELIIDPLLASTFLGGNSADTDEPVSSGWTTISLDTMGNVYVCGTTFSLDFPTTPSAYDIAFDGSREIFISKFDSNLQNLLVSTFFGGSEDMGSVEGGKQIIIDQSGNVYICGYTSSSDFPITLGAYDTTHNGGHDGFITKFDSDLVTLLASTFLGGNSLDTPRGMAIDSSGYVYVSGVTSSSNFPTILGCYDSTFNGSNDMFVSKFNNSLQTLLASTFIGGNSSEQAWGIAITVDGNIYLSGNTQSSNFPTTPGAYDTTLNGGGDGYITKLDSNLQFLLASTLIGGSSNNDTSLGIAIADNGNVFLCGFTSSSDFPITIGAYDTSHNGSNDVYIVKFASDLKTLLVSTFFGGEGSEMTFNIAIDNYGSVYSVYLAGSTNSADFPITPGAYNTIINGSMDVFVSKLDSDLHLLASTFLGGEYSDYINGWGLTLDQAGDVYVAGGTHSSDFPTTTGAYDTTYNSNGDVFIAKLDSNLSEDKVAPTAAWEPTLTLEGALALDGRGSSDVDGMIASYHWQLQLVEQDATYTLDGDVVSLEDIPWGCYNGTLTVKDDDELTGSVSFKVCIPKCELIDLDNDGYTVAMGDCDDNNAAINPDAQEICDGIDNNCDGQIDEGFDLDADGFFQCGEDEDCNDSDASINPDAIELPGNDVDENCDGSLGGCDPNDDSWKNHGAYVRCVAQEVEALVIAGVITEEEGNKLVNSAAQSDIGK